MARKREDVKPMEFEERAGNGKAGQIFASVTLYGVMLLLGYVVFAVPEAGTAMGAVRGVLRGLGGSVAVLIPLFFGWIATLVALKAAGRRVKVWKSVVDVLLWLSVFMAAQMFVAGDVVRTRMTIHTFANFVDKSYGYGAGGGAIGAMLAWWPYTYLGAVGGVLAAILAALLALTATGRLQRFIDWCLDRFEGARHDAGQRRMEKDNERLFDYDDFDSPKRRRMDPASDEVGQPVKREAPPVRRPRPARSEAEASRSMHIPDPEIMEAGRAARVQEPEIAESGRAAHVPGEPEERERRRNSNSALQRSVESLLDEIESAPDDGPSMAAFDGSKRGKARKKVEADVPESVKARAKKKEETKEAEIREEAKEEIREEKPKSRFGKAKKVVEEGVQALRLDDDLTIEPDTSDVLENDDPPFDMPDSAPKKPLGKLKRPAPKVEEEDEEEPYNYPPIDLLAMGDGVQENHRDSDMEKAQLLEETLKQFGISTKLTGIAHGPAVTRFELQPAPGVKVSRIASLADDIAMHLAAMSVRIEAPIPGKAAVGVEIPNEKIEMVRLRDVLESAEARKSVSKIAVGLGKDNAGRYIVADVAKMPHVLIAGQTGSGKSVCINSIITSILFRATPDEVKLILIDPKMVELSIYNDIPHLVCPVVTDCKKAASALDWAVAEMAGRYKKFSERGVRDIKGYNKALEPGEKIMPQMVIIIDELADLMMVAPGEVEDSICRLAQLARAAGMHLVIATQRPSVNVITGIIKANIPTRIAFSVASQVDSRTMIDHGGAEKLLGNGDMLFVPSGINKPMRVQGAWVSDDEVHAITNYIKERSETAYDVDMIEKMDNAARTDAEKEEFVSEYDPKLPEAVEIVVEAGQASVSMLQRRMRVGYARAGRLIDEMQQRGIVSEADGAKPRSVLITREEMNELFSDEE